MKRANFPGRRAAREAAAIIGVPVRHLASVLSPASDTMRLIEAERTVRTKKRRGQ